MENRTRILEAYTKHLQHHGPPPKTVHAVCQELDLSEREFFQEFASLDSVEGAIWGDWISGLIASISNSSEWSNFSARNRYLTFLFAFTEASLDKRSLIILRFGHLSPVASPQYLKAFEAHFKSFASELMAQGVSSGEIASRGPLESLYPAVLYVHFRAVISFLIKDESQRFERTDAFIEKTVAFAFDVLRTQAIDSAFDLARFLAPSAWGKMS
jgi:hypothetical protein